MPPNGPSMNPGERMPSSGPESMPGMPSRWTRNASGMSQSMNPSQHGVPSSLQSSMPGGPGHPSNRQGMPQGPGMANNPSNMMSGMPPTSQPNMPGMPQYQPGVSSGSSSPMYRSPFPQALHRCNSRVMFHRSTSYPPDHLLLLHTLPPDHQP